MAENGGGANRAVKAVFAAAAFLSIIIGLVIYFLADALGINQTTAEIIAVAFLIAGFADYLLLHFWDRIFKSGRE